MTTEEIFNKEAKWLIGELQSELIASGGEEISFEFLTEEGSPSTRSQKRIIQWLTMLGAIKSKREIHERRNPLTDMVSIFSNERPVIGYDIKIDTSTFTELRKIYEGDLSHKSAKKILEEAEALGRAKQLEIQKLSESEKIVIKLRLDEPSMTVILSGKKAVIPVGNQWVLCKELFKKPASDWVLETDVLPLFNREGKQSFYDAQRLLNARLEKYLGINDLIEYDIARARIDPKTIEKLNHSEK